MELNVMKKGVSCFKLLLFTCTATHRVFMNLANKISYFYYGLNTQYEVRAI